MQSRKCWDERNDQTLVDDYIRRGLAELDLTDEFDARQQWRGSLRVKPYYLCHMRLGHAAQLLAHEQCRYDAGERRRAENPI